MSEYFPRRSPNSFESIAGNTTFYCHYKAVKTVKAVKTRGILRGVSIVAAVCVIDQIRWMEEPCSLHIVFVLLNALHNVLQCPVCFSLLWAISVNIIPMFFNCHHHVGHIQCLSGQPVCQCGHVLGNEPSVVLHPVARQLAAARHGVCLQHAEDCLLGLLACDGALPAALSQPTATMMLLKGSS